ncbi:MAG: hypothetical protein HDQ88_05115 [Clostridia bacterium]|nr:hypothetical protein [Clostridia bacterium]
MTHYAVLYLNPKIVKTYNEYMERDLLDYDALGFKSYETAETWSVTFPDKKAMDVKVCTGNRQDGDVLWCEGVLFTEQGCEIACTEVMDELDGKYMTADNDDEYVVEVRPMDVESKAVLRDDHLVEERMNKFKTNNGYATVTVESYADPNCTVRAWIDADDVFEFTTVEHFGRNHDRKITVTRYSRPSN